MRRSLLHVFPLSLALGAYALAAPAMVKETVPAPPKHQPRRAFHNSYHPYGDSSFQSGSSPDIASNTITNFGVENNLLANADVGIYGVGLGDITHAVELNTGLNSGSHSCGGASTAGHGGTENIYGGTIANAGVTDTNTYGGTDTGFQANAHVDTQTGTSNTGGVGVTTHHTPNVDVGVAAYADAASSEGAGHHASNVDVGAAAYANAVSAGGVGVTTHHVPNVDVGAAAYANVVSAGGAGVPTHHTSNVDVGAAAHANAVSAGGAGVTTHHASNVDAGAAAYANVVSAGAAGVTTHHTSNVDVGAAAYANAVSAGVGGVLNHASETVALHTGTGLDAIGQANAVPALTVADSHRASAEVAAAFRAGAVLGRADAIPRGIANEAKVRSNPW